MKRPFPFGTAPRPLALVRVDRTAKSHPPAPARAADLARMTEPIREGWRPPAQVLPFRPPPPLPPPPPAPSRSRTAMAAASLMLALMIALVIAFAQAARPPPPARAATAPSVPTVPEPPASADTVSTMASAATAPAPRALDPPRQRPWDGRRIVNPWE
jgi:hypothetical protein